jgi:hypothetical protein
MTAPTVDRRRRIMVVAALSAGAVAATLLVTAVGGDDTRSTRSDHAGATAPSGPSGGGAGPRAEVAGMPAGFSRDEPGAVQAAIAYATASQRWLYFTDDEITAAVAQITTPIATPATTKEVLAEVRNARDRLGDSPGRVWWLVRPLAWQVEARTGDDARVSVWILTVLSATEVAAPQASWVTVTLDLEWHDTDWKVDDITSDPGPTPMAGPDDTPWDALAFDDALAGFTRMDGEPVQ